MDEQSEITCSICSKYFSEPKVLSCLHCYCKDCIINLTSQTSQGDPIVCPQCQCKTMEDVNELKAADFIRKLQKNVERMNQLNNSMPSKCEWCILNFKAEKFCQQCDKLLCKNCVETHSTAQMYLSHKTLSFDQLKENAAEFLSVNEPQALCHIHNQPLDYYCFDCNCCICLLCIHQKQIHEHHQFDENSVVTTKIREKFKNELRPMKELHSTLRIAAEEINEAKNDVKTQEESNIQQLSTAFEELHKILDERQQELVNRAKELAQIKIDSLMRQEKVVSQASVEVQCVVDFTEKCMRHSNDYHFMNIQDVIDKRLDQMVLRRNSLKEALKPKLMEKVVVEVAACANNLIDFCRVQTFVAEQTCIQDAIEIAETNTSSAEIADEFADEFTIVKCEICYKLTCGNRAFCTKISRIICPTCATGGDAIHLNSSTVLRPPNLKCPVHKQEIKSYCSDCKECICNQCRFAVKGHEDHKLQELVEAAKIARDDLCKINCLPDLHEKLKLALNKIKVTREEIKDQEKSLISSLRDSFTALRDILSESEQEYIEKVQIKAYEKLERLLGQEKRLSKADENVQSIGNFTKESVVHLSDPDILKVHAFLIKRIIEIKEVDTILEDSIEPMEIANVGVEVPSGEALKHLCRTQASIIEKIDPLKSTVDINKNVDLNVPVTATLVTRLRDSQQAKRDCKVSSYVQSLCDGVVTDCNIEEDGQGMYTVYFTPIVRGCHWLTILVDEEHVLGSPFLIFASANPTSLKKPVKAWIGVINPFNGTLNSKHDIFVIERFKRIVQLTAGGNVQEVVHNCNLVRLSSIACDKEDNIYGIDELSNRMFTCDRNGDNTQLHEVELINGTGRGVLIILDNELVTTDRGETQDTLCVYDREFNLINSTELTYKISDMCADSHGNIYATDTENCCVHVFNKHGVQLQTFNLDEKCVRPRGIYIFDQQVYLTDCTNHHCVAAFSTTGTFIFSIGGEQEEHFHYPVKVFVDRNSFIYVFDFLNHRILCF